MEITQLINKSKFLWGVSGHNRTYAAYPEQYLEQQITLAAQLKADIYRFNFTPTSEDDFRYLDNVISACERHHLQLFLILEDRRFLPNEDLKQLEEKAYQIALRYKGKIPFYQISNEQDNQCLCEDSCGEERKNYDIPYTKTVARCMTALANGVRKGDANAAISVNISYKHTYFLTILLEEGMAWDISGVDWYSNMGDPSPTIDNLLALPANDIFVAEANTWQGSMTVSTDEQLNYLENNINWFCQHPSGRIKGYMLYELLDEPLQEGGEAFYGLIHNTKDGVIGEPKPIYHAIRKLWTDKITSY